MSIYPEFLLKLPIYALLALSAGGVVVGDYFVKKWSIDQKNIFLLLTFIGYFTSSFFYIPTLLKEGLVITSVLWVLFSTIGFLFIGIIVFKETLNPTQITGVVLGVIAILLLAVTSK